MSPRSNDNVVVLGLTGRKCSGKSTAFEQLAARGLDGYRIVEVAFGWPLKVLCKMMIDTAFGVDFAMDYFTNPLLKEEIVDRDFPLRDDPTRTVRPLWQGRPLVPRLVMQEVGDMTRHHNVLGSFVWANNTKAQILHHIDEAHQTGVPTIIVVTDVRFPQEVKVLTDTVITRRAHTLLLRVVRPTLQHNATSSHQSEAHIDTLAVDYEITNNGSVHDLHDKLVDIIKTSIGTQQERDKKHLGAESDTNAN